MSAKTRLDFGRRRNYLLALEVLRDLDEYCLRHKAKPSEVVEQALKEFFTKHLHREESPGREGVR